MPTFSPEQYQFIGWFVVTAGALVLATLVLLRKLGFDISLPKRNGIQAPPSQVPRNGELRDLTNKIDNLSGDHNRHAVILGKLADARVEQKTLAIQQLQATHEQTALLRDRLPAR